MLSKVHTVGIILGLIMASVGIGLIVAGSFEAIPKDSTILIGTIIVFVGATSVVIAAIKVTRPKLNLDGTQSV